MNKQRKTSHILNVFQYDADGHVVLPASLTLGIAPTGEDNSGKVPTTAWVRSIVGGAVTAYSPTSRTITINETSYDLSANRAWSIDTGVLTASAGSGISVSVVSQNLNIVNTGLLTATSGSGISVSTVNQNLNIVNTGLLSATAGAGISVSTVSQNLNIVNTGLLTATAGSGITVSVVNQNLNVVNTGILTASAGSGISLTVVGQNLNVVNTGVLTASAGAGISLSIVGGNLNVVNTITNNNQLTNGAGYITSSALTGYATETYVGTQIANLVDAAPGTLDTLNELAAALGDDPNFATTIATSIGTKQAQLNGTGFVKISGTTISYDNSTYLTTSSAASTYVSLSGSYANPAWITSLGWSKITSTPTTISGYGITNAYTDAQIQNFFNGANAISGYNKSNWDTAYGWGNHASAGYVTSSTADSTYLKGTTSPSSVGNFTLSIGNNGSYSYVQSHSSQPLELNPVGNAVRIAGNVVWHQGNLNNLNQLSNGPGYITSYTETDTLASVTGRGATTSSPITINGGGSQPLSLTTSSGSPWHLALVRSDLGLTSRVFAHNSPYNGWYFEHNISIAGNTNWHSGNLTNLNQLSNGPGYITSSSLSSYLPLSGGTMSGTLTLASISGTDQTVENTFGAYLHLGAWGVARTATNAVLVNTAYRADYATDLFDMNISRFTNNSGYITSSGSISGNAATASTVTGSSTINGFLTLATNWAVSPYTSALTIIGTHPSMTFRGSNGDTHYLIHMDANGDMQYYFGPGHTTNNWTRRYEFTKGGNFNVVTGNISASGTVTGSNLSGTNTGDQTNISGNAATVTINYNDNSNASYQLLWGSGNNVYGTGDVWVNPNSDIINARGGFISTSNPWGTSNSAFFPNGITTAGGTNWIYGSTTYIGNAPANGAGHEFYSSGSSYSTGNIETIGSMRAPIFYDRNDTTYYGDFASTSRIRSLNMGYVGGQVYLNSDGGTLFFNANGESDIQGYSIGTTMENYGGNYTKLTIDWHTGIKIGAASGYGGIRFYNNSVKYYSGSQVFSVAEGDSNVRVSNTLFVNGDVRSPIYYDSNDTAYYLNPAGGSRLRNLYVGDSGDDWSDPGGWGTQVRFSNGPHVRFVLHARSPGIEAGMYVHTPGSVFIGSYTGHDVSMMWAGSRRIHITGSYVYTDVYLEAAASMRAPIFYDSNDTGYYLDPNGTSNLQTWTADTAARIGRSRYWTNRWAIYGGLNDHMTGTNGWGMDHGGWDTAWKGGFSGWDIWGTGTGHPQGGGYIHAQGIISGQHAASLDGSSAYGWMMVGAHNATENRYWLRGKWSTSTSGWVEMITTGNIGSQSVSYANSAGSANSVAWGNVSGRPTGVSSFTNDSGYITSGSNVVGLYSSGFGNGNFTWYQSPGGLAPYTGSWASFLVSNHGDGATYYNQTIIMPFWGPPQYSRKEGGPQRGPYTFWTTENLDPNNISGNFYASGSITAGGDVTAYSDARVKKDISPITTALEKTLLLKGVSYKRTDIEQNTTKIGFIAQDVKDVLPEVVTYDQGADRYGVSYGNITALLVEAIKEQQKQIEELQNKLDNVLSSR